MRHFSLALGLIACLAAGVILILTGNHWMASWPMILSLAIASNLYKADT